jgi:hypothetical protein
MTTPFEFKDSADRTWSLELTFATVEHVKRAAKLTLSFTDKIGEAWAQLIIDDELALRVVWAIIESQAQEAECTREQFDAAMNGARLSAAIVGLRAAILELSNPRRRALVAAAMDEIEKSYGEAATKCADEFASIAANMRDSFDPAAANPPR